MDSLSIEEKKEKDEAIQTKLQGILEKELLLMKSLKIDSVDHLAQTSEKKPTLIVSPLKIKDEERAKLGHYTNSFMQPGAFCIKESTFSNPSELENTTRFMCAGAKEFLYFDKTEVKAAIVTCGGLCPGLNVVIRELVMTLYYTYKVKDITGIKWGYQGFWEEGDNYIPLYPEKVKNIHLEGGSILGAGRVEFDVNKVMENVIKKKFNQLYIIGGDGTHKGIMQLVDKIREKKLKITIAGIPKTIDNDIRIIDYSFGFASSVEAALKAIESANVEATNACNGIGLVKVMGRDVGHIALHASLASRDVNICLVPEFKFDLDGDKGLLKYIFEGRRKQNNFHTVIVVAEGAALGLNDRKIECKDNDPRNADIGKVIKTEIENYAKKNKLSVILKYIDPSYMIRSVPANSFDREYCALLAQNAVHGAMAGFTNFTCGSIRGTSVWIPIERIAKGEKNCLVFEDRGWQRLLASTGQPSFLNVKEEIA